MKSLVLTELKSGLQGMGFQGGKVENLEKASGARMTKAKSKPARFKNRSIPWMRAKTQLSCRLSFWLEDRNNFDGKENKPTHLRGGIYLTSFETIRAALQIAISRGG